MCYTLLYNIWNGIVYKIHRTSAHVEMKVCLLFLDFALLELFSPGYGCRGTQQGCRGARTSPRIVSFSTTSERRQNLCSRQPNLLHH